MTFPALDPTRDALDPRRNFAPIHSEDDFALQTWGAWPNALSGALYRNGPNPQFVEGPERHWFVGDGMIHGFFVANGAVSYRNRWVRTPRWTAEHQAGRALFGGFAGDGDPSVASLDSGVANTNVIAHAGRLLALEEAHDPFELDPLTLESRGYAPTGGRFTAHPKLDPATGELLWFAYAAGERPLSNLIDYGVTDAAGTVGRHDRFAAPYCSMVHDFMATERHVLFPVLPLTGDLERVMRGGPAFAWEPKKGGFLGVLARDAGVETIRWFETGATYIFHVMNAWENGAKVFADVMEYPRPPGFPDADGTPAAPQQARLVRWSLDLAGGSNAISRQSLDDIPGEFPRIDDRFAGRAYRHGWFAGSLTTGGAFDCLVHIDHKAGNRAVFRFPERGAPSEPVFVPRRPDADEGDGWIMAVVYRPESDDSELVLFDAQDLAAGPIAGAVVPRRVPYGFHGDWVAAGKLG